MVMKYHFLRWMVRLLVRSKTLAPSNMAVEALRCSAPLFYVVPSRSMIDVLSLQQYCLQNRLPDPLAIESVQGIDLPRLIFLDPLNHMCSAAFPLGDCIDYQRYFTLFSSSVGEIQCTLVSLFWGRRAGLHLWKQGPHAVKGFMQQLSTLLFWGRDHFIHFSSGISLRALVGRFQGDPLLDVKLIRGARLYYLRQSVAVAGPRIAKRTQVIDHLLQDKLIRKAINNESTGKRGDAKKNERQAVELLQEIAADFNERLIRWADSLLTWLWRRFYREIVVNHVAPLQQLAYKGHVLIYVPCHRSHMDYLLLSYILYHHGLVPPYIAAGVNLNFWPVGPLLRKMGAFFMRRTFKGNRLYATLFKVYLTRLLVQRHAIEYFIEGGRSRSGLLLEPKTGLLTMTLQAMLHCNHPISVVPVYIGYEHIVEETTYVKEYLGAIKKKENIFQLLRVLYRLPQLGQVAVNFGQPIALRNYLYSRSSLQRALFSPRINWLMPIANRLAQQIMVRINYATAVNGVNLCATALLAAPQQHLTLQQLTEQVACYLQLLRDAPYTPDCTLPVQSVAYLIAQSVNMGKFHFQLHEGEKRIQLTTQQALLLSYYRNNTQHLFILPAFIAYLIVHRISAEEEEICTRFTSLYPLLQPLFFMHDGIEQLPQRICTALNALQAQHLILPFGAGWRANSTQRRLLENLAAVIRPTLQRCTLLLSLLRVNPQMNRTTLLQASSAIMHQIAMHQGEEQFIMLERKTCAALFSILRVQPYFRLHNAAAIECMWRLHEMLLQLVDPEIGALIKSAITAYAVQPASQE